LASAKSQQWNGNNLGGMENREPRMSIIALQVKHWVLRHYLWVALILLLLALAAAVLSKPLDWKIWVPILGIPFSFLWTIQKQKIEELELFKKLFTEFNRRYGRLNDKLNAIRGYGQPNEKLNPSHDKPQSNAIEGKDREDLYAYFNLCAEEWLFYREGYIYPDVWKAWFNGMKFFRQNPRIKELWDKELETDSYYGLTFDDDESEPPANQNRSGEKDDDQNAGGDGGLRDAA
jgi:hypothetical protein